MTTDAGSVQAEQVSQTEQVSTTGETTQKVETPEISAEQKMATLIQTEVAKAIALEMEKSKRELQSVKDKARAEVESAQRRARLAETTLGTARTKIGEQDPELAKELELQELRAREQGRMTLEQEEQLRQQQTAFAQKLNASLIAHLESLGIDPKDSRIDWASDATEYVQGRSRFDASVAKIIGADKQTMQTEKSSLEKRLSDLEAKVNQVSVEANSVNTTTSQGVVAGSDAEFIKKFGSGELPMNKENVGRYNKLVKSY